MLIPSSGSPVLLRADQGPHEVVKRPFVKGPSNTALHPTPSASLARRSRCG
jgi:hypothetical protein